MYTIECKICNKTFESDIKGPEKSNLIKHFKLIHNISKEDYVVKYYHNNIKPLCLCGCGNYTEMYKFKFNKYYLHHKNYILTNEKSIIESKLEHRYTLDSRIKLVGTSEDILKATFEKFKTEKYTLIDLSNDIQVDRRTVRKFWKELKLASEYEINKICDKTRYLGIKKRVKNQQDNLDEYLDKILLYIDVNNNVKHTINQVKKELDIPFSAGYLMTSLKKKYGDDILTYFKFSGKSNLEIDFYSVLSFYFGNRIKMSYKIENRYFDYILDGKLLIELDGTYWHSTEEAKTNDKYKNELAIKNGFQILRIAEKNIKDINVIQNIIKISEKL